MLYNFGEILVNMNFAENIETIYIIDLSSMNPWIFSTLERNLDIDEPVKADCILKTAMGIFEQRLENKTR